MPATLAELPASPQAIYEDRSLFTPTEPADPELVSSVMEGLFKSRVITNSDAASFIRSVALGRRVYNGFENAMPTDVDEIAPVLTLSSLEWYIHQNAQAIKASYSFEFGHSVPTPISGLINGMLAYQSTDPKLDRCEHKIQTNSGVFVIPEVLEGQISHLFMGEGRRPDALRDFTFIGDAGQYFAEGIHQGERATLYGNAGDRAFANAGAPVRGENKKRPIAKVYGSVGDHIAESAESLMLTVTGDAGDYLAERAGYYLNQFHSTSEEKTSVIIRVNGSAGKFTANEAVGSLELSCGKIVSLGEYIDISGSIHEGPFHPGSEGAKTSPGRLLIKNGEVIFF